MEANVFNIQRFSLHDGPGIRTVVFLKGCPLRCAWCANPESQLARPQLLRDAEKCALCGACVRACVRAAVRIDEAFLLDGARCAGCGACAAACPNHALTLEGRRILISEIVDVCMRDLPFYEESGGGVTLSGGEPLSQPEAARALLDALRGVHTAIETTGYASPEVFDSVCGGADLLLIDLKHWDDARHVAGTGVSNARILSNISRAAASGREMLIRIPVIPGYNDSPVDAERFAELLLGMGIARVQLLPFHQFGERKYAMLGMAYAYENAPGLHADALGAYRERFHMRGVDAFF